MNRSDSNGGVGEGEASETDAAENSGIPLAEPSANQRSLAGHCDPVGPGSESDTLLVGSEFRFGELGFCFVELESSFVGSESLLADGLAVFLLVDDVADLESESGCGDLGLLLLGDLGLGFFDTMLVGSESLLDGGG